MTLVAAIVAEQLHLNLMNECLVKRPHRIAQNHIDSKEVISCFDDRNPVGRFWPCLDAGELVPAASRFSGIIESRS